MATTVEDLDDIEKGEGQQKETDSADQEDAAPGEEESKAEESPPADPPEDEKRGGREPPKTKIHRKNVSAMSVLHACNSFQHGCLLSPTWRLF